MKASHNILPLFLIFGQDCQRIQHMSLVRRACHIRIAKGTVDKAR